MGVITRPNDYSDGNVLTAAQLDADFNTIYSEFNGNIDNANIASDAAIDESKIAFNTTTGHTHDGVDSYLIQVNRAFPFYIQGTPSVANDLGWNPTVPQAMTAVKLWAKCKTAPTGADLIVRVYNVTDGAIVATCTIAAGATTGSNASMTTAALTAGDVLRVDVTQIGSTVPGANISVVLECTQP